MIFEIYKFLEQDRGYGVGEVVEYITADNRDMAERDAYKVYSHMTHGVRQVDRTHLHNRMIALEDRMATAAKALRSIDNILREDN